MADGTFHHGSTDDWHLLETNTRTASQDGEGPEPVRVPALTVLAHFDPGRIGEVAWLADLARGERMAVSRGEPFFQAPDGGAVRPLLDPRLSRRPLWLSPTKDGVLLDPTGGGSPVEVDGEPLDGIRLLSWDQLERGVVLLISRRVTLVLRTDSPVIQRPPSFGLVGEGPAMLRLRAEVASVADLDVPVLLRGESGTGKELVARAIQSSGPRRNAPFLSLNMGALPPELAASELFGAAKGAYSGAERSRPGYFRRADGGTLFLDEIGETPPEAQALLLRALESGEVQPLGGERPIRVDVRIIAATDAHLEEASRAGSFKAPLLHRLRGYEIQLPPLRERTEDLGRLFHHFLRQELRRLGRDERLLKRGPYETPFVPATLLAEMAISHSWPGNVRELRNLVRQLAITSRTEEQLRLDVWREQLAASRAASGGLDAQFARSDKPSPSSSEPAAKRHRDPGEVSHDELISALQKNRWNLKATAESLGISRASLYVKIDQHPDIRKASDLAPGDIEHAIEKVGRGLEGLAMELSVSKQGLKRRMTQLKMT